MFVTLDLGVLICRQDVYVGNEKWGHGPLSCRRTAIVSDDECACQPPHFTWFRDHHQLMPRLIRTTPTCNLLHLGRDKALPNLNVTDDLGAIVDSSHLGDNVVDVCNPNPMLCNGKRSKTPDMGLTNVHTCVVLHPLFSRSLCSCNLFLSKHLFTSTVDIGSFTCNNSYIEQVQAQQNPPPSLFTNRQCGCGGMRQPFAQMLNSMAQPARPHVRRVAAAAAY